MSGAMRTRKMPFIMAYIRDYKSPSGNVSDEIII